jgi:hypothetical protein
MQLLLCVITCHSRKNEKAGVTIPQFLASLAFLSLFLSLSLSLSLECSRASDNVGRGKIVPFCSWSSQSTLRSLASCFKLFFPICAPPVPYRALSYSSPLQSRHAHDSQSRLSCAEMYPSRTPVICYLQRGRYRPLLILQLSRRGLVLNIVVVMVLILLSYRSCRCIPRGMSTMRSAWCNKNFIIIIATLNLN